MCRKNLETNIQKKQSHSQRSSPVWQKKKQWLCFRLHKLISLRLFETFGWNYLRQNAMNTSFILHLLNGIWLFFFILNGLLCCSRCYKLYYFLIHHCTIVLILHYRWPWCREISGVHFNFKLVSICRYVVRDLRWLWPSHSLHIHALVCSHQVQITEEGERCVLAASLPSPIASCCAWTSVPGTRPASSVQCVWARSPGRVIAGTACCTASTTMKSKNKANTCLKKLGYNWYHFQCETETDFDTKRKKNPLKKRIKISENTLLKWLYSAFCLQARHFL